MDLRALAALAALALSALPIHAQTSAGKAVTALNNGTLVSPSAATFRTQNSIPSLNGTNAFTGSSTFSIGSVIFSNGFTVNGTQATINNGAFIFAPSASTQALRLEAAVSQTEHILDILDSDAGAELFVDASFNLDLNSHQLLNVGAGGITFFSTGAADTRIALVGSMQSLSGAGAVNVTTQVTKLTSTGGAQALTLANGTAGQVKTIVHDVDGGSMVLTPTTKTGFSTITFTNAGDTVTLMYFTTRGWMVIGSYGVTIAP